MSNPPIVWTVAGSDSGGGAGLQADLRAFDAFGVHGCSAVAAVTAQNSISVRHIDAVSPALLDAQLAALAGDMPPAAIKTGLLGSAANLRMLAAWIDRLRQDNPALALVVDPVLRSSTGASFADEELLQAYRTELLPRATVGDSQPCRSRRIAGHCRAARIAPAWSRPRKPCAKWAARPSPSPAATRMATRSEDYASTPHASGWLSLPRVATRHNHGTGCVFASSAAAALASGFVAIEALVLAKMATTHALRHG